METTTTNPYFDSDRQERRLESRLTETDIARIRARLAETYRTVQPFTWTRIAANAIGCSLDDLRYSEVEIIDALVAEICVS